MLKKHTYTHKKTNKKQIKKTKLSLQLFLMETLSCKRAYGYESLEKTPI